MRRCVKFKKTAAGKRCAKFSGTKKSKGKKSKGKCLKYSKGRTRCLRRAK